MCCACCCARAVACCCCRGKKTGVRLNEASVHRRRVEALGGLLESPQERLLKSPHWVRQGGRRKREECEGLLGHTQGVGWSEGSSEVTHRGVGVGFSSEKGSGEARCGGERRRRGGGEGVVPGEATEREEVHTTLEILDLWGSFYRV